MTAPEREDSPLSQPWIVFPEIIGVTIVAVSAPIYLARHLVAGHIALALAGFVCWLVGVGLTVVCLRKRMFVLAFWPMLLLLGVGLLIHKAAPLQ
jgi:hypothetical protein